jgi:hypothetical protein
MAGVPWRGLGEAQVGGPAWSGLGFRLKKSIGKGKEKQFGVPGHFEGLFLVSGLSDEFFDLKTCFQWPLSVFLKIAV